MNNSLESLSSLKAPEVPYVVAKSQKLGRYLIAAKDLYKGEIILEELPLASAPQKNSSLICPGCFINSPTIQCAKCGWPICSLNCPRTDRHAIECTALFDNISDFNEDNYANWNLLQDCLMALRCLSLKTSDNQNFQELIKMETNWRQWSRSELFKNSQEILKSIRNEFGISEQQHSNEEIMKILAILDINAYEIKTPEANIQGCYKLASLAQHSCIPNALKTTSSESLKLTLRAVTDISKGSNISTSYCDTLWPTFQRQRYIQWSKFFICQCQRCSDSSELGSNISCLLCPKCPLGTPLFPILEPSSPSFQSKKPSLSDRKPRLKPIAESEHEQDDNVCTPDIWKETTKDYHCQRCDTRYPGTSVESLYITAESQLQELDKDCTQENITYFENWLDQWTIGPAAKNPVNYYAEECDQMKSGGRYAQQPKLLFFHPKHALCLDACHTVFLLYSAEDSTIEDLERKQTLGNHLLESTSTLFAGISAFRGTILHELSMTKVALVTRLLNEDKNPADLRILAKDALSLLNKSLENLQYESEDQPEGKLYTLALKQKDEIEPFLKETIPDL